MLVKDGKTILRAEARQHLDLDTLDRLSGKMNAARQRGDRVEAQRHMRELLKRYPDNFGFKVLAATDATLVNPEDPLIELADLQSDPKAPKAEQAALLEARAQMLIVRGDLEGAIRELVAAIDLSPQDYPGSRWMLAQVYQRAGRLDEAEVLFEEAFRLSPESMALISQYQILLYKQRKFDQGDKLGESLEELEGIYAPR